MHIYIICMYKYILIYIYISICKLLVIYNTYVMPFFAHEDLYSLMCGFVVDIRRIIFKIICITLSLTLFPLQTIRGGGRNPLPL